MTKEQIKRGQEWMRRHPSYIVMLVVGDDKAWEPSGSDASHPELWKDGHWRWFMQNTEPSEKNG